MNHKFITLPINNWENEFAQIYLGGITCDSHDYYSAQANMAKLMLPRFEKGLQQYIGFFNMGAYQESLAGYGGIQHCLIPAPKHVLVDLDKEGNVRTELYRPEQTAQSMLDILGYVGMNFPKNDAEAKDVAPAKVDKIKKEKKVKGEKEKKKGKKKTEN
jgi:arginine decarboxylase